MSQTEVERKPVESLDQVLKVWEQTCFMLGVKAKMQIGAGMPITTPLGEPLHHYSELRRHILKSAEEGHSFDKDRFLGTNLRIQKALGPLGSIPESLYGWSKHSRRVFELSDDISRQLLETDLDGVLWSDVRFPFNAYGMKLETSIQIGGSPATDFLLLNEVDLPGGKGITLSMLPTMLENIYLLSNKETQFFTDMLYQRRWQRTYNKIVELDNKGFVIPEFPFLIIEKNRADFPVTDGQTVASRMSLAPTIEEQEVFNQAARLVVGFCLYLKQLPPGSAFQSEWQQVISTPDRTAITKESQVCYITSTHPLTRISSGEVQVSGRGGYEMKWHLRRGYWSRRPGEGDDPGAPKIVWHPPTEVRKDRKPAGDSIPGGAETIV